MRNGEVSHWFRAAPAASVPAPALADRYDLVVVGGGLTGLWTAFHASQRDPAASILVLEAERVGYGASGRNGGWLSPLMPGNRAVYARRCGTEAVQRFQRVLIETIDEVVATLDREGIDACQHHGGHLTVATTPAGMARARATRDGDLRYGYRPEESVELDAAAMRERIDVAGAVGGLLHPTTVRVDPALLVHGLVDAVRRRGVTVREHTPATGVVPGSVRTAEGSIGADRVVVCLEAYTSHLLGGRDVIPVSSAMVVTEPLPAGAWDRIGWEGGECFNDSDHTFVYAQRTADDRIAIGGRGTPYAFGSGLPGDGAVDRRTVAALARRLGDLFPGVDLPLAHAWRGVIGVTRDWCAGVLVDDARSIGVVRGFAGHGVTATHLAGRTVLDRLDGAETALTGLPWNEHRSPRWEPEPLRYLGVHAMYRLFGIADRWEHATRRPRTALIARVGSRLAGLHE